MYDDLAKKYKEGSDFSILCADLGPAMIEISKEKIEKKGWKGITAEVIDQNDLSSLGDGTFTHALTGLGINFVKDADKVLQGEPAVAGVFWHVHIAIYGRLTNGYIYVSQK